MKAADGRYVLGAYLAAAVAAVFTIRLVDLPLLAATAAADAVATVGPTPAIPTT